MTTTSTLPDVGIELREGYAEVGDQRLHCVEAGDGPLLVLLHGFPEFWKLGSSASLPRPTSPSQPKSAGSFARIARSGQRRSPVAAARAASTTQLTT
jgi:pimeloyl-ACP methyl ester carboxylesterase